MSEQECKYPPIKSHVLYDKVVEAIPGIERKGKTTPYTSLNGHMFSFLTKEGTVGLRLSKEEREELIEKYNCKQMTQHGRVMKEFVEVPAQLLPEIQLLVGWFQMSLDHTSTLKPKPTNKK